MVLQTVQYTQYALLAHRIVAAAVHVIKIVVMDAPALLMALVSVTSVLLVAWVGRLHGT